MVREKVKVSTQRLQWKCVESRADSKSLYYGRFILATLKKGQADTIGIAMRRALLGEIEGTCITRATFEKIPHEYTTIAGIQESVYEILINLKEIILRSNLYGTCDAYICVRGPGDVTAQDIILPPYVEIVDNTQHIATLTEPMNFCIGLQIERARGYSRKTPTPKTFQDGTSYPIDGVFMPVLYANHSIQSYGKGSREILFLEIWTNGSLTPKEALREASRNLINLLIPFLHAEAEEKNFHLDNNKHKVGLPLFSCYDRLRKPTELEKRRKYLRHIYIDQLGLVSTKELRDFYIDQLVKLPPRIYNCLKRSDIHTLWDILAKRKDPLNKIGHLRSGDVTKVYDIIEKNLSQFLYVRRRLYSF
uniref:DNA-directed RNA polymerase n=1 Tax=Hypseocharis bilobata TaxID=253189 RepID=V9P864_9ROSI|nr:RNA polymerase alpha subunit [Hypseocharis bilobata]AGV02941.1 RNA polymerase alpha subunit [Hypseocharis bilobata]AKF43070.1 RNA polymerase alpha subunit [Hypseocharis bilobata]